MVTLERTDIPVAGGGLFGAGVGGGAVIVGTDIPVARSVWSASSLLALSLSVGTLKAGASSAHSKRFAPRNVRTAPPYVTGLTTQSTKA
jgi:hypothetical protein